jgi:MscS family membrane protein
VRKTLKVFVTLFGIVFIAGIMGLNVTGLLAGLGLGGIAVALAAKDSLENLFGSVVVLLDRPFRVGDWVKAGAVEGTVENVGFRSTRIRTFQNSLVTVPNAELMRASIDNMGAREFRRVNTTIPLEYSTPPDKIDAFCEGVRTLILKHPYTRKDNYHVWLNEFGENSLDVLLYFFLETPDWATELRERHRLFLDTIRLADELGIRFALPVRRVYMEKDEPAKSVFPEKGTIFEQSEEERKRARELAESITGSGLGGEGKIPAPVEFPESAGPPEDLPF